MKPGSIFYVELFETKTDELPDSALEKRNT